MRKRISAIFLAASVCLSLLPAAAAAGSDGIDDSYTYDEAAHTVQIKAAVGWQAYETVCAHLTNVMPNIEVIEHWVDPEETGPALLFHLDSGATVRPEDDVILGDTRYDFSIFYMPIELDDGTGTLVNFEDEDFFNFFAQGESSETSVSLPDGEYLIKVNVTDSPVEYAGSNGAGVGEATTFYVTVGSTETPDGPGENPSVSFSDVASDAYYADSVSWAVEQGVTDGTSDTTFSPDRTCTRAQIITFLWRAAGSPEPAGVNAFVDVAADAYYAEATAWAAENDMASGEKFYPDAPCTREMAVEFMWKHAGSPSAVPADFADISSGAVDWAVANGVTDGTSDTTFSPDDTCTRGQIVTFLYRAFAE